MTAFLFIPTTQGTQGARRVDFANIGSVFTEVEAPASTRSPFQGQIVRLATIALILVGVVGDTILVARPHLLADVFARAQTTSTPDA